MWRSRTKDDLIIEVWEKLDCESVGRLEIEAIETAVGEVFGANSLDPPMILARRLSDEGAHLRHAEIMELYLERAGENAFDIALRNAADLSSIEAAVASIKRLENLRKKLAAEGDRSALRELKESVIEMRRELQTRANSPRASESSRELAAEVDEWLANWLKTPEIFFPWLDLRRASTDFKTRFSASSV